ncbi:D-alanyl-D-alanine carboxypeptidase family protein, partial [Kaarinaea lacus]
MAIKRLRTTSIFLISFLLLGQVLTANGATLIPAVPKIKAKGFLLIDYDSGRILAENKPDTRMEPASLTKMLTSYVVAQELKRGSINLSDMVTVSKKAWRMQGSRMFIEVGKKVSVEDLLKG